MTTLATLRAKIDKTDASIIKQLAKRQQLSEKIGQHKHKRGQKVLSVVREKQLTRFYRKLCREQQLDIVYVMQIFAIIIEHSRRLQQDYFK